MEASAAPSARPERLWPLSAGLALATLLLYANCLDGPFLFDDLALENPIPFRSRPVVRASFALHRVLGANGPSSYHLVNVLVHAAAGLLLFGSVRRTLDLVRGSGASRSNAWIAWSVALLWLVHPLQTESVAYISQRAEALAGLFVLGLFYGFARWVSAPRSRGWALFSLASFALGMGTKEIVATAPLLLWLYDRTFVAGGFRAALRARPRFYLSLALVWAALFALLIAGLVREAYSSPEESPLGGYAVAAFTPLEYLRTQPGVVLHYLRLVFWPHPLCLDYAWPPAKSVGEIVPQTLVLLVLVVATSIGIARCSVLGFLGAWFFVILAPTSSFVPIQDAAFEHRMYLPLAAVVVLVVLAAWRLCARVAPERAVLPALLLALAALLSSARTWRRNLDYRSPVRMWDSVLAVAPHNPRAHRGLGLALLDAGRPAEAVPAYERAIELAPRPGDFVRLGYAHLELDQPAQAIEALETALQSPQADFQKYGNAYLQVASAHVSLGKAYLEKGDVRAALRCFERALAIEPSAQAHVHLANARQQQGDAAAAERHYREAIRLGLDVASVHFSLARVLWAQNEREEAAREYEATLRLDPDHQEAHQNLGVWLSALGRRDEALEHYRRAVEIPPNTPLEHTNLGQALLASGRHDEAAEQFRAACRLDSKLPRAFDLLARALLAKPARGAPETGEALGAAEDAVLLGGDQDPELLATLGEAQAAAGELERARATLERALALVPGEREALRGRLRAALERCRADAAAGR